DVQRSGVQVQAVVGGGERLGGLVPALVQHLRGNLRAQRLPGGVGVATVTAGQAQCPVQGQPAHHLGVDTMARFVTLFPDAVVGFVPAPGHCLGHGTHQLPVPVDQMSTCVGQVGDEFHDGAEDVELDLAVGEVAHAHRARPCVSGEVVDDLLGAQVGA